MIIDGSRFLLLKKTLLKSKKSRFSFFTQTVSSIGLPCTIIVSFPITVHLSVGSILTLLELSEVFPCINKSNSKIINLGMVLALYSFLHSLYFSSIIQEYTKLVSISFFLSKVIFDVTIEEYCFLKSFKLFLSSNLKLMVLPDGSTIAKEHGSSK